MTTEQTPVQAAGRIGELIARVALLEEELEEARNAPPADPNIPPAPSAEQLAEIEEKIRQEMALAGVANLSGAVQAAAGGGAPGTALEQVNAAKNQAELIEAAKKGGFLAY